MEIGQKLAMIADELDEEYGSEIDSMIDQLQLTSESAYFSFHEMAMRLLRRGESSDLTPPCIHDSLAFRCNVGQHRSLVLVWIPHYCSLLH